MTNEILTMAVLLCAGHWLADYPLQSDFLVKAKVHGPLRIYHLIAHAGMHGAVVLLVTGNVLLGLAEWGLHVVIDEAKIRRKISFAGDQALHLLCKLAWLVASIFLMRT